jgi:deoxyribonuclease-4
MLIGAHVSMSSSKTSGDGEKPPYGNMANAVWRQEQIGGNCGQVFTHSPQVWDHGSIGEKEAEQFREATAAELPGPWVIHTSYLVNLCTPKEGLREKSRDSMQQELDAAAKLDIEFVNVHLGAHTGAGVDGGLENAIDVIDSLDIPEGVKILVESDAGSGTKLGGQFEHLARVVEDTEADVGVCVDTAHAFAAGYDLSTPEAVDEVVAEFDAVVGNEHLHSIHLNDSKHECGTNKDEHAHIGDGYIGDDGMRRIVNHPDWEDLPFVLETPTEDGRSYAWNVQHVRELRE